MAQIKKFNDYDSTQTYSDRPQLPKGAYICKILKAEVKENKNGQYIQIAVDIAEGEYKGFFRNDWDAQDTEDKKWHCNYLLNVPKDDGTKEDGWTKRKFKTFTVALEDSNEGYHFDWDSDKFKGKIFGGLFNLREYEYEGKTGKAINLALVTSAEKVRTGNYKLPEDRLLPISNSATVTGKEDFMKVPDEEECPF